jgi:hypothetical protein
LKKLLILCSEFPPSTSPARERPWSLARYLPELGWNVKIITKIPQKKYDLNRNHDNSMFIPPDITLYQVPMINWMEWMMAGMYRRKLIRIFFGFPDSFRLWANDLSKQAQQVVEDYRPDIILSTSPPNSVHVAALNIVRSSSCKWVVDLQDAWLGNRLVHWVSPLHEFISQRYYRQVMKTCDIIVTNNHYLQDQLLRDNSDIINRVVTVPIGYEEALYNQAQPHRIEWKGRVALYSGDIYNARGLEVLELLCSALDRIQKMNTTKAFRLDTIGKLNLSYKSQFRAGPYPHGYVNFTEVPEYLFGADALVLYMPEVEQKSTRILLKSYGYARVQRPILYLGPRNATYEYLISNTQVEQFELTQIEAAASWLANLPVVDNNQLISVPAHMLAYSFENTARSFAQLFDSL